LGESGRFSDSGFFREFPRVVSFTGIVASFGSGHGPKAAAADSGMMGRLIARRGERYEGEEKFGIMHDDRLFRSRLVAENVIIYNNMAARGDGVNVLKYGTFKVGSVVLSFCDLLRFARCRQQITK
jgi:hypothetical protein